MTGKMTAAQREAIWDEVIAALVRKGMFRPEVTISQIETAVNKAKAAHIAAQIEGADDAG